MKNVVGPVVPDARVRHSHTVARVAGILVVAVAAVAVFGWVADIRWLAAFSRTSGPIKFNAAVGWAALGLAITLLGGRSPGRLARLWGSALAAGAVALALATAVEYVSGGFPYIDEILVRDRYAGATAPGRMALMAVAGLVLIGSGLLLHDARQRALHRLGEACLLLAGTVGLLAAIGRFYAVPLLTGYGRNLIAIAHPAVVALLIAFVGALAARPERGVMAVLLSKYAGGVAARRLLPVAFGVPLVLGWLRHVSEQHGLVETRLGAAVLVVSTAVCLATVVVWLAGELNRSDVKARLAAQLRQEIEVRTAAQAATAAAYDELRDRNDLLARSNQALDRANADLRRLAAIVQFSDDAILASDLDGTITDWNPGAQRLYGYTAEEAIGTSIYLVIPAEQTATVRDRFARIGQGEHVDRYEGQRMRKDGSVIDVSVSLAPLLDKTGTVTGVSVVAHDITDRKAAQAREQLLRERSQAAERLESLGQLAGGVAHDFNNVLAIILNYAAFIAEQTPPDNPVHADAVQITTSAQRAAALVDQLMVFARKEPAKADVFDLNTVVTEVRLLLERALGEHIQVITRLSGVPLPVRADHTRIQQILLNMAFNARDAMPTGGTLILEVTPTDLDDQSISLSPGLNPGRYARLLVSDTGAGMPPEVVARVFEPFFTTKPKGQGTGLGMATVYGTITQLGGNIKIYSEPDVGTTMRVYLPLAEQPSTASGTAPSTASGTAPSTTSGTTPQARPPRGQGQIVLAVDDEAAIRHLVARVLNANGYTAVVAESGPQALKLVKQHRVDVLLTDVIMPEMNGRELADALLRTHPHMSVVYMSGYSDGLLSAHGFLTEDTTVIQKPFTAHELLQTLHTRLAAARTNSTS